MSIPLISFQQQRPALLLSNYLQQQSIANTLQRDADSGHYVIVLQSEADIERAKPHCELFISDPNHPRYQQAAWNSGQQVKVDSAPALSFNGLLPWAKQAPFSALLLATCTIVFVLSLLGWFTPIAQHLMLQPLPILMQTHEWWRLLGPALIHFSVIHFVFNLLWWSMLGAQVERTLGVTVLVVLFVVSAVSSNLAQLLISGPNFGGLSGVVYALLGFVWWIGWLRPSWGLAVPKPVVGFMLVWLLLGYADVLWVSMANTAHLVGLISGCAMAAVLVFGQAKLAQSEDERP